MAKMWSSRILGAAAVIALAACGAGPVSEGAGDASTAPVISSHGEAALSWEHDWDAAFDKAKAQDKVVLASFQADWCVWCRRLETTTYRDNEVASILGDRTVALSLDVDGNGKKLSDTYGVDGLPTVVVFSADGRELGRIDGYLPPSGFLERLEAILPARS